MTNEDYLGKRIRINPQSERTQKTIRDPRNSIGHTVSVENFAKV